MGKIELDHTGAGAGITLSSDGTDLLLDGTAVGGGGGGASALTIDDKTAAYTVVAGDLGKIINCTSNTFTVSLTAAATLGAGFHCWIRNSSVGSADVITVDPSGSETIDSLTTIELRNQEQIHIASTGTNFIIIRSKLSAFSDNLAGGGTLPTASGKRAVAIGNSAAATAEWSNAFGLGTSATANHATAIGQNSSGQGSKAVTGLGAMALGGSMASGTNSLAAAITNNTSSYGASGTSAVAIGYLAKASGNYSTALGYGNASGTSSVAIGGFQYGSASATGTAAVCIGGNYALSNPQAIGNGSMALHDGSYANAQNSIAIQGGDTTIFGQFAYAGGEGGATAQTSMYVLKRGTTDATPSVLVTQRIIANASPSTTNQIILRNNSAYSFSGTIVARQQASQGTASAAWKVEGLIRREGSAGTTVLVNSATTVLDNTPAWGMALTADVTRGGLAITVTGAAATNIRWVATIHTSEVIY